MAKDVEKLYAFVKNNEKFLVKEKKSNYDSKIRPLIDGESKAKIRSFKINELQLANDWLDSQKLEKTNIKNKKARLIKKPDISDLTTGQSEALNLMTSGENLFLTGVAGSGKSYLIDKFAKVCDFNNKNLILLATTGIAAVNINGMTIHKFLKWRGESFVNKKPKTPKLLKEADIVLIEEISMCSIDLFDYFCDCLEKANNYRKSIGKKPVQLIVVGDFCQLPPVITKADEEILKIKYPQEIIDNGAYCFLSDSWKKLNFKVFKLNEVIRQQDKEFSDILDRLRVGDIQAINWINTNASKTSSNGIELSSWRNVVAEINSNKLNSLNSKSKFYRAVVSDDFPENIFPTEELLELKVGCRVMSLTNDTGMKFQNGSLGTVLEIDDNSVKVEFDNGNIVALSQHSWSNNKYYVDTEVDKNGKQIQKVKTKVIGSFSQIPLKLAYATTIHKSQGKTFDKLILNPQSFADGQLYVALSRVSDIKGLFLREPIRAGWLKTSPIVLQFEKSLSEVKHG